MILPKKICGEWATTHELPDREVARLSVPLTNNSAIESINTKRQNMGMNQLLSITYNHRITYLMENVCNIWHKYTTMSVAKYL